MKRQLVRGATNVTVYVFIQDSSSTTGAGLTGLVFGSAGLVASQVRPLAARVAITLVTQTVTGAHSDGGFVEVDATNMPGVYRLDLPDAVCATGVDSVVVMLKGATNMAPLLLEIQLTNLDLNTRLGATQMTESYAAEGVAPTLEQILYMSWAALSEFSISGLTITVQKIDGTTAMTFTLDDATNPTSRARAT